MQVRTGRWDIPGRPIVILIDYNNMYPCRNELFTDMWNWFGVDSLPAYGDYDESCILAYASALVIESFYKYIRGENLKVIAQKRGLSVNSLISEMAWDFVEDWKIKYENVRST